MKWRILALLCTLLVGLVPGSTMAQPLAEDEPDDLLIRINGNVTVPREETVDSVFVISANAVIDGTVRDTLWVIDGDAVVSGTIDGDVVVINGAIELTGTSTVHDLTLIKSTLVRSAGATVTGDISEREDLVTWSWGFQWAFWAGMTVAVIAAGMLFALAGGRQLAGAAGAIGTRAGETVLTALVVAVGLPVLAVAAFMTVVGIPLGLGIFLFLIPALGFLGYLVTGAALGAAVLKALGVTPNTEHPFAATAFGLLLLQLLVWMPWLGGPVLLVAGTLGAGALVYQTWAGLRGAGKPRAVHAHAM
jgi:hypothetical protein